MRAWTPIGGEHDFEDPQGREESGLSYKHLAASFSPEGTETISFLPVLKDNTKAKDNQAVRTY